MTLERRVARLAMVVVAMALAAGCGGGSAPPSPSASPPPSVAPVATSPSPSASTAAEPSSSASTAPVGAATLDAPASVEGGVEFEVAWTGAAGQGDYVTMVVMGVTQWTNEQYFYTTSPSPGKLVAPTTAGEYELWYVRGASDLAIARRPITVTPFTGALGGPGTVAAGSPFTVAWNGPNGPDDYVTIVAAGTAKWTNEVYFYTHVANPGTLVAPIKAGAYELWYVTGDGKTMATRPISVTPFEITLDAPDSVAKGAQFQVTWTGPNGPSDYITIVPAGSKVGTYLTYAYTAQGSPATITAPDQAGKYEIWYASDRVAGTFATIPIEVK